MSVDHEGDGSGGDDGGSGGDDGDSGGAGQAGLVGQVMTLLSNPQLQMELWCMWSSLTYLA